MSGILLASCMAGTTILLLSWRKKQTGIEDHSRGVNTLTLLCVVSQRVDVVWWLLTRWFPSTKKMWPSKTSEHAVSLFRSSALDIFRVSLRNLLLIQVKMIRFNTKCYILRAYLHIKLSILTWPHCNVPGRKTGALWCKKLQLVGNESCRSWRYFILKFCGKKTDKW